ncbi:TPA: hypothetical protein DCX16_01925 [bacterium]|nr:hypothetical protein [bacterium]
MTLEEFWEKARNETQVLRARAKPLSDLQSTIIDYLLLAESQANPGNTVVRKGKVWVHKPLIILPKEVPIFEGFDFEDMDDVPSFMFMRGVQFPALKYSNIIDSIEIYRGVLSSAIDDFMERLQQMEDIKTGLIKGIEQGWQFSVLIYVAFLVLRQVPSDIRRIIEDIKRRMEGDQ